MRTASRKIKKYKRVEVYSRTLFLLTPVFKDDPDLVNFEKAFTDKGRGTAEKKVKRIFE